MIPAPVAHGITVLILLIVVGILAYRRGRKVEAQRWLRVAEYHRDHRTRKHEHATVLNDYLHLMWLDSVGQLNLPK